MWDPRQRCGKARTYGAATFDQALIKRGGFEQTLLVRRAIRRPGTIDHGEKGELFCNYVGGYDAPPLRSEVRCVFPA